MRIDFKEGWLGPAFDTDNEAELVSTMRDPGALRFAVNDVMVESNLGKLSWNTRRDTGRHDEWAYVQGRLRADRKGGAIYFAVAPEQGAACQEVLYVDNGGAHFRVPLIAPNMGGTATPGRWFSDDGRRLYITQSDPLPGFPHGRIVVYDNTVQPVKAVGFIRVESL